MNSKSKEKDTKIIKMNKSKEKDNKIININSKSKEKDGKVISITSKSKEKDNKIINMNSKSKEKENKIININSKSKEKDGKVIALNKSKGKDGKIINVVSKSKGKESSNEKKEPIIQKSVTSTNKISVGKNIKEVKKGNKSPNPGNGIIKKKIIVGNPKPKTGQMIKISPGKIPKEKINSAKGRVNTDNNEIKKPHSKQGQRPQKTSGNRKIEKSPNPNIVTNKK